MLQFHSRWLDRIDYLDALAVQEVEVHGVIAETSSPVFLGCEHPSCVTLGRSANPNHEILPNSVLPQYPTDRGGRATIHSPGQLVVYPILSLPKLGFSVRSYVDHLLLTTADLLRTYSIACRLENQGLHTEHGKIASVGVRVRRGISSHGISINISNDLRLFEMIRSCGVLGAKVDRVTNHAVPAPDLKNVFYLWTDLFSRRFSGRLI